LNLGQSAVAQLKDGTITIKGVVKQVVYLDHTTIKQETVDMVIPINHGRITEKHNIEMIEN
jgi:hypothetical protein